MYPSSISVIIFIMLLLDYIYNINPHLLYPSSVVGMFVWAMGLLGMLGLEIMTGLLPLQLLTKWLGLLHITFIFMRRLLIRPAVQIIAGTASPSA